MIYLCILITSLEYIDFIMGELHQCSFVTNRIYSNKHPGGTAIQKPEDKLWANIRMFLFPKVILESIWPSLAYTMERGVFNRRNTVINVQYFHTEKDRYSFSTVLFPKSPNTLYFYHVVVVIYIYYRARFNLVMSDKEI